MTGKTCIVCRKTRKNEPKLAFHRFPEDAEKRAKWLKEFGLCENQVKSHSQVCSRHFRDGDPRNGICNGNADLFLLRNRMSQEVREPRSDD